MSRIGLRRTRLSDAATSRAVRSLQSDLDITAKGVQGAVQNAARVAKQQAALGGKVLGEVELTPGTVYRLAHGLSQSLRGWTLHDLRTDGATGAGHVERVLRDGSDDADPRSDIWVKAVGFAGATKVTVRVWVY